MNGERSRIGWLVLALGLVLLSGPVRPAMAGKEAAMTMQIGSSVFENGGGIPRRYTCDGEDRSPPLHWSGVPTQARSLVLIVDDPDAPDPAAPRMTWVHWVLFNLPPDSDGLPEAVPSSALPPGTVEGINDWKRTGYGGPCPPIGRHRYYFKLYALDSVLPVNRPLTKPQLLELMQGHLLDEAVLMGTYQRP